MTRSRGSNRPLARRAAIATLTVLTGSGIGLVAAPAFGQIVIPIGGSSQGASVTNAGSASANSGGNTAIGNASTNTAGATVPGAAINVPVSLGAPTNTSEGTATITSGAATAAGNSSDTGIRQSNASGNTVNSFLASQNQGAGVLNAGSASANSGGNNAIGNGSQNSATITPDATGGLLGVTVGLGAPTNTSTGSATITSGAANAVGNNAGTGVTQAATRGGGGGGPVAVAGGPGGGPVAVVGPGGGPGGFGPGGAVAGIGGAGVGPAPCSGSRFGSFQNVNVNNRGQAEANTGNNTAIGNASTNNANVTPAGQTVSGGLLGVGVTIGGPVNNSTGTAVINTGPATATGNDSTTGVTQLEGCPQVATLGGGGRPPVVVVPAQRGIVIQGQQAVRPATATLARTGLDTGDLGMIAGGLLGLGILLVASQRQRFAARVASVPLAGLGFGLGTGEAGGNDWDSAVR